MPRGTPAGGRLAGGAAKGTGYVRESFFPTHVASSKHVSPLATVCSLWLFPPFSRVALLGWPPLLKRRTAYVAFSDAGIVLMTSGFAFPAVDLPAHMRARSHRALAKVAHVWRPEIASGATDETSHSGCRTLFSALTVQRMLFVWACLAPGSACFDLACACLLCYLSCNTNR